MKTYLMSAAALALLTTTATAQPIKWVIEGDDVRTRIDTVGCAERDDLERWRRLRLIDLKAAFSHAFRRCLSIPAGANGKVLEAPVASSGSCVKASSDDPCLWMLDDHLTITSEWRSH